MEGGLCCLTQEAVLEGRAAVALEVAALRLLKHAEPDHHIELLGRVRACAPKRAQICIMAFMASLFLAIFIAFFMRYLGKYGWTKVAGVSVEAEMGQIGGDELSFLYGPGRRRGNLQTHPGQAQGRL